MKQLARWTSGSGGLEVGGLTASQVVLRIARVKVSTYRLNKRTENIPQLGSREEFIVLYNVVIFSPIFT